MLQSTFYVNTYLYKLIYVFPWLDVISELSYCVWTIINFVAQVLTQPVHV